MSIRHHNTDPRPSTEVPVGDDDQHEFLFSILRKRRRPLLLVVSATGELLFSSLPHEAPAAEQRLLGEALGEAKALFLSEFSGTFRALPEDVLERPEPQLIIEGPQQKSTVVALDGAFYTLRIVPLHGRDADDRRERFAALIEPIVGPLADGVDFERIKQGFRLSNREVDVLQALMSGSTDKEIAQNLGLSAGTVRSYLKSVRVKLGVTTRTAIVNLAHEFMGDDAAGKDRNGGNGR